MLRFTFQNSSLCVVHGPLWSRISSGGSLVASHLGSVVLWSGPLWSNDPGPIRCAMRSAQCALLTALCSLHSAHGALLNGERVASPTWSPIRSMVPCGPVFRREVRVPWLPLFGPLLGPWSFMVPYFVGRFARDWFPGRDWSRPLWSYA